MRLNLETNSYGDSYRSDEEYGEWSENNYIDYTYATISKNDYGEPIDWEAKIGDVVFLVHVVYSSGDSFGHSTGNSEVIEVLRTVEEAEALAELIRENYEKYPDYSFEKDVSKNTNYIPYKGRHISTSTWKGYFESLQSVEVVALIVKK